ncbi:MAG: SMC-Scp complex subunit ScpB [Bacillota bacterium]|jgi:segregation and condensation protein B|nr:SMC-Scp complex subunit ScpB [Bacillota bacterium]HHU30678.1 SMC-Scp complex subunit ScpB [Bacillota bacterium]
MELKPLLEALLFVAEEPMPPARLAEITGAETREVRRVLKELQKDYEKADRGLQLVEIARGFQLSTKPAAAPVVEKLFSGEKSYSLSNAALETLAIIAYRQPVTRIEIESIRGVKTDKVLETLRKRRFIRIVGRKDVPGRPLLYGTTREFLKYFGLKDLSELPPLIMEEDKQ